MKGELDKCRVGLVLGTLMGLLHLAWALLVATGFAQVFMDFIYSVHFLNDPFYVSGFSLVTAVTLVVVTFVFGYVFGWVFAYLWGFVQKKK